jgi:hypothetical protein
MTAAENIEPGILGAKRASWRHGNTRELLLQIIAQNRKAVEKKWRSLFLDAIKEDAQRYLAGDLDEEESLFITAVYSHFANCMLAVNRGVHKSESHEERQEAAAVKRAESTAAVAQVKGKLQERVVEEARIILLELAMPNGKTLGECTGQDCKRFGGWFARIAKAVPARKRVAEALSEDELWKLWRRK